MFQVVLQLLPVQLPQVLFLHVLDQVRWTQLPIGTTHRTHVHQRDEDPSDDANRPHKHQKILRFSEHEDDSYQTFFEDAEIDDLERYDYGLDDEERADDLQPEASMTHADVFKRLTVPSTMLEPSLTAVELLELDVIADAVEIERLKKMNVLFPAKTFEFNGESPNV